MKPIVFSFLLLFIFKTGDAKTRPDTVIFWQVYLNGYLLKSFNENQRDPTLTIALSKITKDEKLLIKYFRDTPCASCPTHLIIYDDEKNEVLSINGKGTFASLSFAISRLTEKWNTESVKYFVAYYFENKASYRKLLFTLKFE
jgi:hypothetical protein